MCAIFGFIGRGVSSPSIDTLGKIVRGNIARGPHSFGLAWLDGSGRLHCYKQCGRFTDHLGILALARGSRMLIGHLRYATHGAPEQNINNHPHPADGGWIVHNGIIRNYERLVREEALWPVSECDSEVLGLLIERSDETSLVRRCAEAVETTSGSLAMMGLWARPSAMIVARQGNPLHISETQDGIYLATMSSGLPGRSSSVRDDTIRVYHRQGGAIKCRTLDLESESETVRRGILFDEDEYRGG